MSAEIRNDLRSATDPESMCELLRSSCERFGTIRAIDVLPMPRSGCNAVACVVDMQTAEEARAAQGSLVLASFGARSLVCVVDDPRFSLSFPFHYLGKAPRANEAA